MKRNIQNILLIDDDEINNFITLEFIRTIKKNVNCHCVNDGEEALTYLTHCPEANFPDMIFVDLLMPYFDGFDFLEEYEAKFYEQYPNTILFMLTSSLRERDSIRAERFACLTALMVKDDLHTLLQKVFPQYSS